MSQNKLRKIKENDSYKTELCKYYHKGRGCRKKNNCDFAHGFDEMDNIERIRNYLNNEKEEKLRKYKMNIDKIYNELKNESKDLFKILNIKLSKRIIFDILFNNKIKIEDTENIYKDINDIIYIYEVLCLEYYFNCQYNLYNESFRKKLIKFFKKFSGENTIKINDNKWITYFFNQIEKINSSQGLFNLSSLNLYYLYTEKNLFDKYNSSPNILYDKLLFLLEIINQTHQNENFIKYYFNAINRILNNISNKINILCNQIDFSENYECLVLSKLINFIYNCYCNDIIKNKNIYEINEKSDISSNINETMKKLIKINLDDYFKNTNNKIDNLLMRDYSRKKMTEQIAFIIEFIFKYFDLCLFIFYKENQTKFINHFQIKI